MTDESQAHARRDLDKVDGALDLLFDLRETFAQWVEEAQDDSKHESLDNVLAHIESVEREFKHRRQELRDRVGGS